MEQTTLNLCLFGEGGGDAAQSAGDEAAAQPAAEAAQPALSKAEAFNRLITGEYRDEYVKRTQQMIDTRFKQSKELESRYNALCSVLDALGQRRGANAAEGTSPMQLTESLQASGRMQQAQPLTADDQPTADDAQPGAAADPGSTVPEGDQAPQEPADPRIYQRGKDPDTDRRVDLTTGRWAREAWQLKNLHPEFDMAAELQSPSAGLFFGMLNKGIPMQTAWQALHMDELMRNAITYAVQNTRQRTMESIRARGLRPEEAAAGTPAAAAQILRADPAQWNPDEMNSAIQQARMGKKIYL